MSSFYCLGNFLNLRKVFWIAFWFIKLPIFYFYWTFFYSKVARVFFGDHKFPNIYKTSQPVFYITTAPQCLDTFSTLLPLNTIADMFDLVCLFETGITWLMGGAMTSSGARTYSGSNILMVYNIFTTKKERMFSF